MTFFPRSAAATFISLNFTLVLMKFPVDLMQFIKIIYLVKKKKRLIILREVILECYPGTGEIKLFKISS